MLKNTQKCNIFDLIGGGGAPGELASHAIHFLKGPVELMSRSNWHVTASYRFRDIRG